MEVVKHFEAASVINWGKSSEFLVLVAPLIPGISLPTAPVQPNSPPHTLSSGPHDSPDAFEDGLYVDQIRVDQFSEVARLREA